MEKAKNKTKKILTLVTLLEIEGIDVEVVRKPIRNLHLRVFPPDGKVRVTVPFFATRSAITRMVTRKLEWIKYHQQRLKNIPRTLPPEMLTGASHYFLGQPYILKITEQTGSAQVELCDPAILNLCVQPQTGKEKLQALLDSWYRKEMEKRIPEMLERWQKIMGVQVADWGIKKMKTRWGSCNIRARRIWLNLELAKKPIQCLEYVLVHELVHLFERLHNARFYAHMDRFMPNWREHRETLNRGAPLADD